MHLHYLQHVPFETPAYIKIWGHQNNHPLTGTHLYRNEKLQSIDVNTIDVLVVLGGPMGVHDEEEYPWLSREKDFIRACIKRDKKVLGICLGAQLIADVLGAEVVSMPEKEIGWFPIRWTEAACNHPILDFLPDRQTVLHWHGDRFEIPDGAIPLAESEACSNQGFMVDNHVLGLQFHLEMTLEGLSELIANSKSELADADGRFIQKPDMMLNKDYIDDIHQIMSMLFDRFFTR